MNKYPFIEQSNAADYEYQAKWNDLKGAQKAQGLSGGDDVRACGYVLDQLGIPNREQFAEDVPTEDNQDSEWIIYWI